MTLGHKILSARKINNMKFYVVFLNVFLYVIRSTIFKYNKYIDINVKDLKPINCSEVAITSYSSVCI